MVNPSLSYLDIICKLEKKEVMRSFRRIKNP